MTSSSPPGRRGVVAEVARGFRTALSGLRTWGTNPRLMVVGLIPGLITAVVFGAGAVLIVMNLESWSDGIADALVAGDGWFSDALQVVAALAILGAAALVGIYTFTAVTLVIGQPFFERLAREVDASQGFVGADPEEGAWRSIVRGIGEALRLALLTVPLAVVLFLIGLIPVVGGVTAFVLGAAFGGWFLALELTTSPLARRGVLTLHDRRAVLRGHRARVVGFGAACFLAFLLPLGAIAFMPAAVAGATHLVQGLGLQAQVTPPRPAAPRT
ncbi:EI24 domain-containing protein [Demequina sp. NBRC 110056]|uniref:EI24 domain-containing protein n=1 Tax=Demequina sp. NBRC 110056 TaxID=1570345 RepID=UPI000A050322|nr:EI24 domain-containing protein [Demequina sp. NBRC 110056]